MEWLVGLVLLVVLWLSSSMFWAATKAKLYMGKISKDQGELHTMFKFFKEKGLYQMKPEQLSATGRFWTENYAQNLALEIGSSVEALNKTRLTGVVISVLVLVTSWFFLGVSYTAGYLLIFFLVYLFSSQPYARERINNDIAAIGWNLYWYHKKNPKEFAVFIKEASSLKDISESALS